MTSKRITHAFAAASLAFAFTAAPVAFHAVSGLQGLTASAKEAESGGNKGGKRGGDDHPGAHSQNGKRK